MVWWRKKFRKKPPEMGEVQKKGFAIVSKLLANSDSELIIDPNFNGKRYIKNDDIFVTIERGNLNIINGVYFYDIYLSDKMYEHFVSRFNNRINRIIVKYESQIQNRVESSLTNILTDMEKSD